MPHGTGLQAVPVSIGYRVAVGTLVGAVGGESLLVGLVVGVPVVPEPPSAGHYLSSRMRKEYVPLPPPALGALR